MTQNHDSQQPGPSRLNKDPKEVAISSPNLNNIKTSKEMGEYSQPQVLHDKAESTKSKKDENVHQSDVSPTITVNKVEALSKNKNSNNNGQIEVEWNEQNKNSDQSQEVLPSAISTTTSSKRPSTPLKEELESQEYLPAAITLNTKKKFNIQDVVNVSAESEGELLEIQCIIEEDESSLVSSQESKRLKVDQREQHPECNDKKLPRIFVGDVLANTEDIDMTVSRTMFDTIVHRNVENEEATECEDIENEETTDDEDEWKDHGCIHDPLSECWPCYIASTAFTPLPQLLIRHKDGDCVCKKRH